MRKQTINLELEDLTDMYGKTSFTEAYLDKLEERFKLVNELAQCAMNCSREDSAIFMMAIKRLTTSIDSDTIDAQRLIKRMTM